MVVAGLASYNLAVSITKQLIFKITSIGEKVMTTDTINIQESILRVTPVIADKNSKVWNSKKEKF